MVFPPGTPVFPLIPSYFDGICVDYSYFYLLLERSRRQPNQGERLNRADSRVMAPGVLGSCSLELTRLLSELSYSLVKALALREGPVAGLRPTPVSHLSDALEAVGIKKKKVSLRVQPLTLPTFNFK